MVNIIVKGYKKVARSKKPRATTPSHSLHILQIIKSSHTKALSQKAYCYNNKQSAKVLV